MLHRDKNPMPQNTHRDDVDACQSGNVSKVFPKAPLTPSQVYAVVAEKVWKVRKVLNIPRTRISVKVTPSAKNKNQTGTLKEPRHLGVCILVLSLAWVSILEFPFETMELVCNEYLVI